MASQPTMEPVTNETPKTIGIPEIIEAITNNCLTHKTDELKSLCFKLFDTPNDPRLAEYAITQGLLEYIKKSNNIIKYLLIEMKEEKTDHLENIFRNLVAGASASDNQFFIIFLLNLQKELNIDHNNILTAVCSSENIPFIRDIVTNLSRSGVTDLTPGLLSACRTKLDSVIVFLFKMADDLKMTIDYEKCLSLAINQNSYGILNLFLDRLAGTSDKITSKLIESPQKEGKVMMVDFFLKKCREKQIQVQV